MRHFHELKVVISPSYFGTQRSPGLNLGSSTLHFFLSSSLLFECERNSLSNSHLMSAAVVSFSSRKNSFSSRSFIAYQIFHWVTQVVRLTKVLKFSRKLSNADFSGVFCLQRRFGLNFTIKKIIQIINLPSYAAALKPLLVISLLYTFIFTNHKQSKKQAHPI